MRRTVPLGLLMVACRASTPEPAKTIETLPLTDACAREVATYVAARERLSRCETDSDCAEMPGLCPPGPYYIHRDASLEPVLALERELASKCNIPTCEPAMALGIAHCEAGSCARGREPYRFRRIQERRHGILHMSCWDYRQTWLEADGTASATASSTYAGVTPHVAIAPAAAGTLVLELDWPSPCTNCRLLISEHNSGMAMLITPTVTRTDAEHERLEFPVTPGPYHMIGMADTDTDFTIRADLRDAHGERGRVTRHGVGWRRECEG
jgi:hypothetical protein